MPQSQALLGQGEELVILTRSFRYPGADMATLDVTGHVASGPDGVSVGGDHSWFAEAAVLGPRDEDLAVVVLDTGDPPRLLFQRVDFHGQQLHSTVEASDGLPPEAGEVRGAALARAADRFAVMFVASTEVGPDASGELYVRTIQCDF